MSQEVVKWLGEIRALRQRVAQLENQLNEANQGAINWRKLYSTEAQQRRTEARLAQQTIEALQAEIRQLKGGVANFQTDSPEAIAAIEQEVAEIETPRGLRAKLVEVIKERDRLSETLKAEKEEHEKTRKSLTAVIGDTIDQLAKHKAAQQKL